MKYLTPDCSGLSFADGIDKLIEWVKDDKFQFASEESSIFGEASTFHQEATCVTCFVGAFLPEDKRKQIQEEDLYFAFIEPAIRNPTDIEGLKESLDWFTDEYEWLSELSLKMAEKASIGVWNALMSVHDNFVFNTSDIMIEDIPSNLEYLKEKHLNNYLWYKVNLKNQLKATESE